MAELGRLTDRNLSSKSRAVDKSGCVDRLQRVQAGVSDEMRHYQKSTVSAGKIEDKTQDEKEEERQPSTLFPGGQGEFFSSLSKTHKHGCARG